MSTISEINMPSHIHFAGVPQQPLWVDHDPQQVVLALDDASYAGEFMTPLERGGEPVYVSPESVTHVQSAGPAQVMRLGT
jgi:hypothetical protein